MNNVWTQRSDKTNRGQYAALYTIAWGTAQTTGPFICSLIIDSHGFNVFFITMGTMLILTSIGAYRFSKV